MLIDPVDYSEIFFKIFWPTLLLPDSPIMLPLSLIVPVAFGIYSAHEAYLIGRRKELLPFILARAAIAASIFIILGAIASNAEEPEWGLQLFLYLIIVAPIYILIILFFASIVAYIAGRLIDKKASLH